MNFIVTVFSLELYDNETKTRLYIVSSAVMVFQSEIDSWLFYYSPAGREARFSQMRFDCVPPKQHHGMWGNKTGWKDLPADLKTYCMPVRWLPVFLKCLNSICLLASAAKKCVMCHILLFLYVICRKPRVLYIELIMFPFIISPVSSSLPLLLSFVITEHHPIT